MGFATSVFDFEDHRKSIALPPSGAESSIYLLIPGPRSPHEAGTLR